MNQAPDIIKTMYQIYYLSATNKVRPEGLAMDEKDADSWMEKLEEAFPEIIFWKQEVGEEPVSPEVEKNTTYSL